MSPTDVTRETLDEVVISDHWVTTMSVGYEIRTEKAKCIIFFKDNHN